MKLSNKNERNVYECKREATECLPTTVDEREKKAAMRKSNRQKRGENEQLVIQIEKSVHFQRQGNERKRKSKRVESRKNTNDVKIVQNIRIQKK